MALRRRGSLRSSVQAGRPRDPPLVLPTPTRPFRHTGWSRAHWEAVADQLLEALVPYVSPGASQIALPGRPSRSGTASDGLEGFARSFLLAAFRIAGVQGGLRRADRAVRAGLSRAPTGHPEAWPRLTECRSRWSRRRRSRWRCTRPGPWLWDRLDARAQERVADWLGGFIGATSPTTTGCCSRWSSSSSSRRSARRTAGGHRRRAGPDRGLVRRRRLVLRRRRAELRLLHRLGHAPLPAAVGADGGRHAGCGVRDRLSVYRERLRLFLEDAVTSSAPTAPRSTRAGR